MPAAIIKIDYTRGDLFDITLNCTGYDFTGKTVVCQLKKISNQIKANLEFTTVDNSIIVTIISPTNATLRLLKTAVEMKDLDVGTYYFDIEISTSPDDIYTVAKGTFNCNQDVTVQP